MSDLYVVILSAFVPELPHVLEVALPSLCQPTDNSWIHTRLGFVESDRAVIVSEQDRIPWVSGMRPVGSRVSCSLGKDNQAPRWTSVGLPQTRFGIICSLGPIRALGRCQIGFVRSGYETGASLSSDDLIQLPDDPCHGTVDSAVVVSVGQGGMQVEAPGMWPPMIMVCFDTSPGDKGTFQPNALWIRVDHVLQDSQDTRMVDQELGRSGDR